MVVPTLNVLHYALTTERLRIFIRVKLVHFMMFITEAKIPWLLLDRDSPVLAKAFLQAVNFLVVLAAKVLLVVNAVHNCIFAA